jgi:Cu/Zn superoxide dismutase
MRAGAGFAAAWLLTAVPALAGAAASAKLYDSTGQAAGVANFRAAPHGVLIEIEAKGLAPGAHAVLIHSKGACEAKTGFASAGPVMSFDETRLHGLFAKGGPRGGDLPMQFAGADGTLHASLYATTFSLGEGMKSLFDGDGASLIIHAAGDDYVSQPEGNSGARLLCGTILRAAAAKKKPRR